METMPQLQLSEFQKALTPGRMRQFYIIPIVLLVGATVFLGIILYLYSINGPESKQIDNPVLPLISIVHICQAMICYFISFLIYRYMVGRKGLEKIMSAQRANQNAGENTIETGCAVVIFTGYILRAAFMEGVAFFGLIICLLGITEGVIYDQPIYWFNLFSYVVLAVVTVWTFPTRDRLEGIFTKRFSQTDESIYSVLR